MWGRFLESNAAAGRRKERVLAGSDAANQKDELGESMGDLAALIQIKNLDDFYSGDVPSLEQIKNLDEENFKDLTGSIRIKNLDEENCKDLTDYSGDDDDEETDNSPWGTLPDRQEVSAPQPLSSPSAAGRYLQSMTFISIQAEDVTKSQTPEERIFILQKEALLLKKHLIVVTAEAQATQKVVDILVDQGEQLRLERESMHVVSRSTLNAAAEIVDEARRKSIALMAENLTWKAIAIASSSLASETENLMVTAATFTTAAMAKDSSGQQVFLESSLEKALEKARTDAAKTLEQEKLDAAEILKQEREDAQNVLKQARIDATRTLEKEQASAAAASTFARKAQRQSTIVLAEAQSRINDNRELQENVALLQRELALTNQKLDQLEGLRQMESLGTLKASSSTERRLNQHEANQGPAAGQTAQNEDDSSKSVGFASVVYIGAMSTYNTPSNEGPDAEVVDDNESLLRGESVVHRINSVSFAENDEGFDCPGTSAQTGTDVTMDDKSLLRGESVVHKINSVSFAENDENAGDPSTSAKAGTEVGTGMGERSESTFSEAKTMSDGGNDEPIASSYEMSSDYFRQSFLARKTSTYSTFEEEDVTQVWISPDNYSSKDSLSDTEPEDIPLEKVSGNEKSLQ